jgi:hypothetical protein
MVLAVSLRHVMEEVSSGTRQISTKYHAAVNALTV